MLRREQLLELDRRLKGRNVLSVYLRATEPDFAERTSWRRSLTLALAELRESLHHHPHAEREAFDAAVALLEERLARVTGFLPAIGWVAFVTSTAVEYAEELPVEVPTIVAWQDGPRLAPYAAALERKRHAIVVVLDARRARLFRYEYGALEELDTLHAHVRHEPVTHMGNPAGAGFHTGTRGVTGTDEAERERRAGRTRMMRELAERVTLLSAPDAWVLFGGIAQAAIEASAALPDDIAGRAHRLAHLDVHATDAQIADAAKQCIAELRSREVAADVDDILLHHADATNAVVGIAPSREALRQGAVQRLCLTEQFTTRNAPEAEEAIRTALSRHAEVEVVGGAAAAQLDSLAGGIGARLRYVPWARSFANTRAVAGS